jgi:hypothetical protein
LVLGFDGKRKENYIRAYSQRRRKERAGRNLERQPIKYIFHRYRTKILRCLSGKFYRRRVNRLIFERCTLFFLPRRIGTRGGFLAQIAECFA